MKNYTKLPPILASLTFDSVGIEVTRPPEKSKGGILLAEQTKETGRYASSFGRIVSFGPLAFMFTAEGRTTFHRHLSGDKFSVGDYALFTTYSGMMLEADTVEGQDSKTEYRVMKAVEVKAVYPRKLVEGMDNDLEAIAAAVADFNNKLERVK